MGRNTKKSKIWFVSDTHFGHQKMVDGFSKSDSPTHKDTRQRPFSTIELHDNVIVSNWNAVVGEDDIVYHLGDVILGNTNFEILDQLNGKIKLITGNHDTKNKCKEYAKYFHSIEGSSVTIGKDIIVSHIPIHPCELDTRFSYNIHGHLHHDEVPLMSGSAMSKCPDTRYISVCMEKINYTPVSLDELKERMNNE